MSEEERRLAEERRLRRAAIIAATHEAPEPAEPEQEDEDDAAARRMEHQALWVDLQIRKAIERGDFDNLPGAGKPIPGLDGKHPHDPDWWVKSLIEREEITGVLPPALALRKEDTELDAKLDREADEDGVRRTVEDFNRQVVEARRQLLGGPPVVTPTRDVDEEVAAWRTRRTERRDRLRAQLADSPRAAADSGPRGRRPRRWRRRTR